MKGLETILNSTQKHGDVATGSHRLHKGFGARLGDCSWVAFRELILVPIIKKHIGFRGLGYYGYIVSKRVAYSNLNSFTATQFPKLLISSFFVMPMPESSMVRVELVLSGMILIKKFGWA